MCSLDTYDFESRSSIPAAEGSDRQGPTHREEAD
jgi:hypothetical protein